MFVYNPVKKTLGTTENQNWYTELKSSVSNIVSNQQDNSLLKSINNMINGVNSTIETVTKSFESSGLIENIMSISGNINEISYNISNIINNNTDLTTEDKTALIKLQQAINDGTLVKQMPLNANPLDYQMITINNQVFYIKKNKTRQYIVYAVIGLLVFSLILIIAKRGKK